MSSGRGLSGSAATAAARGAGAALRWQPRARAAWCSGKVLSLGSCLAPQLVARARQRSATARSLGRHLRLPLSCVPLVLSRSTRNQVPPPAAALLSHTISACFEETDCDLIEKVLPVLTRPIFRWPVPGLLSVSPLLGPDMMVSDSGRGCFAGAMAAAGEGLPEGEVAAAAALRARAICSCCTPFKRGGSVCAFVGCK